VRLGVVDVQFDLMLLDEERHSAALESLALQRLAAGDLTQAFKLADRRCRIPPIAKAHHYTLRGEICHQLGDAEAAIADVARALELAPNNVSANRRMLAWSESATKVDAARRLLAAEHDFPRLAEAIAALREAGQSAFAGVEWTETTVRGWAVWDPADPVQAIIESEGVGSKSERLVADPRHPLATDTASAASFAFDRPRSWTSQRLALYAGETLFYQKRLRPNAQHRRANGAQPRRPAPSSPDSISIIVPIYGDYEATKACLESLLREVKAEPGIRVIVIDDASPDEKIKGMLPSLEGEPRIRLMTNAHNLGFAESVNRGLEETGRDDVIFLNADTVVPPGFAARLKAVAHSAPDIGTVTPLSNNGEFTSFPVPFRSNPIPTYEEICTIDATAARANAEAAIDLPNGIGFCLYVTRPCLDAVGRLSEAFHRGYYEDVDLCLRAREFGFRNVCATSVFVGHAGSRSFGAEKRSLVVQNLETIEQWFPKYRLECAAFLEVDPLRLARGNIERTMAADNKKATLLISGSGLTMRVAETRAQALTSKGASVLLIEICATGSGPAMRISNPSKGAPQSITFGLAAPSECAEAVDYLRLVAPARIEIAGAAKIPVAVLNSILRLKCPVDLLIADGGLLCPRGAFIGSDASACDAPRRERLCDDCLFGLSEFVNPRSHALKEWTVAWEKLLHQARHIYAPDLHAKSFASRFLGRREITVLKRPRVVSAPQQRSAVAAEQSIGFVAVGDGIAEFRLMKRVALAINHEMPERPIVVIGDTIDDLDLMKLDNVYVTGAVETNEYDRVLQHYAIDKLFIPVRRPLFGHPKIAALSGKVPSAFFDWSLGEVSPRPMDLPLSPYLTDDELAAALVPWLSQG